MKRGVGPATGDARSVPSGEARFELRVRASRFLGIAVPCGSPEEARAALDRIRRELLDATHVAYAWTAGPARASLSRSSDDGEPAGTAGRPIASAVESAGLSDVLVADQTLLASRHAAAAARIGRLRFMCPPRKDRSVRCDGLRP